MVEARVAVAAVSLHFTRAQEVEGELRHRSDEIAILVERLLDDVDAAELAATAGAR